MRIMVKGGVWKNTEDEILKAAVMKYGKNQWARISSLLVRKSAKQCKSRWYEWLDPSIKKTEWSREEEEKLLHLAKIMPNQWKTIAPIVGRTASQCLEHYEKLLDAAQNKEESYDPAEDPRRLRPGEIDPNPEAKAARPDPIDMDEDEKEMLSEARARLANTKGKKAKRKAREKQLEEARRLAALQKRRELKAAGIEVGRPKRKIKGIDYNREIPFQKKPAPGFYEVDFSNERELANQPFRPARLEDLDQKRKREAEEEEQRKEDVKKQKKREKTNLPDVIMQINKLNDPDQVRARTKLVLPSPQLSDRELEEIAKISAEEEKLLQEDSESGLTKVTKSLLPNYGATPSAPTPLPSRTPLRTPARREDSLIKEAQNLIALTASQTPLAGGSNPELHPTDFTSATPRPSDIRTPSALVTPSRTSKRDPFATPVRDQLSINEDKLGEGIIEKRKQTELRQSLKSGLQSLPAPMNSYNIMLPELPVEEKEEKEAVDDDIDASDRLRKQQKEREEKEAERQRLRSQVLKRDLPRPIGLSAVFADHKSQSADPLMQQAEDLLRAELVKLVTYESAAYPFKQCKIRSNIGADAFDDLSERDILRARGLLEEETVLFQQQFYPNGFSLEELDKAAREIDEDLIFSPAQKRYIRATPGGKKDRIEALTHEFDMIKGIMGRESAKSRKLESKLNVYNGGYQSRANSLLDQIRDLYTQIDQTSMELSSFKLLREYELKAMQQRVDQFKQDVQIQEERERANQQRYMTLITEKEELKLHTVKQ